MDSTGEPAFIRRVFEEFDEPARESGARLLTAVGFDWVPGALAAALALEDAGDDAVRVDVGYFVRGASASAGTKESLVGATLDPSFAWRDGRSSPSAGRRGCGPSATAAARRSRPAAPSTSRSRPRIRSSARSTPTSAPGPSRAGSSSRRRATALAQRLPGSRLDAGGRRAHGRADARPLGHARDQAASSRPPTPRPASSSRGRSSRGPIRTTSRRAFWPGRRASASRAPVPSPPARVRRAGRPARGMLGRRHLRSVVARTPADVRLPHAAPRAAPRRHP